MRHFGPTSMLAVACIVFSVSYRDAACAFSSDAPSPPSVEFGELYGAVQMSGLFSDQKTFADAIPETAAHLEDLLREAKDRDAAVAAAAEGATYAGEPDPYKKPEDAAELDDEADLDDADARS